MKFSILIAAIIVGVASIWGFQQKEKIKTLTTEWEELKTTAVEKNIPTDPKATFSSQRVRSDSARIAREKAIRDFAREIADFALKMEAAEKEGTAGEAEMQKEIVSFLDKLTNMSPNDLKTLVKVFSEDPSIKDETKRELVMMSIMMLSSDNPEAALALIAESAESMGLDGRSRHMLPMVLSQYASKDPEGAAAWIVENEETLGDDAGEIKNGIIAMAAQNNIGSALNLIDTLGIEDAAEAFAGLARGVTPGHQGEFIKALRDQKLDDKERDSALSSLASSPFIKDFDTASEWLAGPDLSDEEKAKITGSLHYYGVKDSAGQWLSWIAENQGSTEEGKRATNQIIRGWTQENFVATGEWIQNQDDGPVKNQAVQTYAQTLAPHEPAAAADWAETLPAGEERTSLLTTIHSSLKEKDADAAAALAEKHQLGVSDN